MIAVVGCAGPDFRPPEQVDALVLQPKISAPLKVFSNQGIRSEVTPLEYAFFGRRGAIWGPALPGWNRVAQVGKK